jgi:hypothetical protein
MKTVKSLIAATALLVAGTAAHAADKPTRAEKNEARLEKLLEGRTAGEPVSCISAYQSDKLQVIEGVAMVYGSGDTIYVARPSDPRSLRWDDVMVVKRTGSQLCNTDIMRTVDRMSGFTTGVVFMDKFVPYKRQD